jgi:preprotein translocase subunit SecF
MKELIPHDAKIDFMGKAPVCIVLSILAIIASFYVFVTKGSGSFGTDFSGGHEFLVTFQGDFDSERIRAGLASQGIQDARVQAFQGASKEYSIRLSEVAESESVRSKVEGALKGAFGDAATIQKTDYVGPTVGKELRRSALLAVVLGIVAMLIYIAIRFEFSVGLGSIIALFHDVVISTGIYMASGHLIGMATLAGALTIVGYSVNDTVVVFDRVREERNKRKSADLSGVINEALNFTLSRTIITHVLTLFSALALYVIGEGDIKDLSLYLVAGILLGAYSTIFIVSPVALYWERFRGRDAEGVSHAPQAKRAS